MLFDVHHPVKCIQVVCVHTVPASPSELYMDIQYTAVHPLARSQVFLRHSLNGAKYCTLYHFNLLYCLLNRGQSSNEKELP